MMSLLTNWIQNSDGKIEALGHKKMDWSKCSKTMMRLPTNWIQHSHNKIRLSDIWKWADPDLKGKWWVYEQIEYKTPMVKLKLSKPRPTEMVLILSIDIVSWYCVLILCMNTVYW